MGHPRSEKRPARRLLLDREEPLGLFRCEGPARCALQAFEVELHLLHQSGVEHASDLEISVDGRCALLLACTRRQMARTISVSSFACCASSIQWCLSRLLNCGSSAVVARHALEVVPLRHPLDVKDDERDGQGMLGQYCLRDGFGRSDDFTIAAEGIEEILRETPEQIDVLGLLAGEVQERADARVVPVSTGRAWSRTNGRMNSSTRPKMYR